MGAIGTNAQLMRSGRMPRYYFNVLEDSERLPDSEGSDLPDLEAVRNYAAGAARDIVSHAARRGELPLGHSFVVTDESGAVVLTVAFKDVFVIR